LYNPAKKERDARQTVLSVLGAAFKKGKGGRGLKKKKKNSSQGGGVVFCKAGGRKNKKKTAGTLWAITSVRAS